jgi:putative ABC transport system permease protein
MNATGSPGPAASGTRRRGRGPWRLLAGAPGPGPVLALALLALLGAFVATAGPRELTALRNTALQQTLASGGSFDMTATTGWQLGSPVRPPVTTPQISAMGGVMGSSFAPPLVSPAQQRWAGLTAPFRPFPDAPPQAIMAGRPVVEVVYRDALAAHTRLVSGSFPRTATQVRRAGAPAVILQAAVTPATAARFGLRPGSQLTLGSIPAMLTGDPALVLSITGIIRPAEPGSAFWTQDPALVTPATIPVGPDRYTWAGAVLVGPGEVAALQAACMGATVQLTWEYPLVTSGLTASQAPVMLARMTSLVTGNAGEAALQAAGTQLQQPPAFSASGQNVLSSFIAGLAAVGTTDSLLLAGIIAAVALLLAVGCIVVTGAYSAELAMTRARGGSTGQLAARMLGPVAGAEGPALAVGILAGIAAVPGGGNTLSWLLTAMVAAVTLAAPPLLAVWQYRRLRPLAARARADDVGAGRRSWGRLVTEATVLVVTAGATVALRLRGLAPGATSDPYLSAAPVLVAVAAALAAAWLYPLPLRLLLRVTAARRGTVGYLGLARSARSRSLPLLPALAMVIALTVVALGGLIRTAVSSGQQAASWQQAGADALVQGGAVSPRARQALAAVPGVRMEYPAFAAVANAPGSANLLAGGSTVPVGVVVADPAQYAALVNGTPWPAFPAGLLAPPSAGRSGASGPVPVIASAAIASSARSRSGRLTFTESGVPIRVAGSISGTPVLPGARSFVIIPSWAAARLTVRAQPNIVLLRGTDINLAALRATVARVLPNSQIIARAAVLQAAADSPLVRESDLVFDLAAAVGAACAAAAVLLGLLLSGRDRTRLAGWLTAMGMTSRQFRRLAFLDALPLVLVAILGAEIAGLALAPLIGPGLVLSPFTGSAAPVPLRPDPVALIAPAAGAVILIMLAAAAQSALVHRVQGWRRRVARLDEPA